MFKRLVFLIAVVAITANTVLTQTAISTQTDKQKAKVVVPTSLVEDDIRLLEGKAVIVYEGDVISIEGRDHRIYSIRLQGIDAPDEKQNNFKKSKNRLADLILGKEVKVIVHKKADLDRYIGSVYLNGRDVGLTQIEEGMAWHYKALSYEQTTEDRKRYAIAEQKARSDRKGLWEDNDPVAPWDFRGDVKLVGDTATKTTGAIDFGKDPEDEKDLKLDRASNQPSRQLAALSDKKAPAAIMEGTVTAVISGDTITIRDQANEEHSIRLSGINAPDSDQQLAERAKTDLEDLILNKSVTIALQKSDLDDLAGKVLLEGKNINSELIKAGLAWHNPFSVLQTDEDRRLYADAEAFAKTEKIGVWVDPNAVPPWASRPAGDIASTDKRADESSAPSKTNSEKTVATGLTRPEEITERPPNVSVEHSPAAQNVAIPRPEVVTLPKPEAEKPRAVDVRVSQARPGATARCNDGSFSYRTSRPGSCSGNGGVAEWLQVEQAPIRSSSTDKKYTLGPRGGCFYLNPGGSKVYVDKSLCHQ